MEFGSRFPFRNLETFMRRSRALGEMSDVLEAIRVEDEDRNRPRFSVIADKLVHNVRILVTEKDAQFQAGCLGDANCGWQLSIHITAPGLSNGEQFARSLRVLYDRSER